jgi:hypothetical protein
MSHVRIDLTETTDLKASKRLVFIYFDHPHRIVCKERLGGILKYYRRAA